MTPDELTRLRELHDAATPAPWYFNTFGHRAEIVDSVEDTVLELGWVNTMSGQEHCDGQLVMEARNALPDMLDHIDRLTRRVEIYEARLGRVARNHPEAYEQALAGDTQ